jgi:CubicO group peptidase (beta-lactamase class C family)
VLRYGADGREVETLACGRLRSHPSRGGAVTADTVYDLASVTKVVATTAVLMELVARGAVDLDAVAAERLPELAPTGAAVRVRHLVGHASGLPAHREFFRRLRAGDRQGAATAREGLVRMAATTPLEAAPGQRAIYSDLGFLLLGAYLERTTGERLDQLTRRLVTEPLGMAATGFVDLDADPPAPRPHPVAPTEICPYRGLVAGEVHDDNAHAGGGVLGHAGLFGTAGDLGRFAEALLAAAAGDPSAGFDGAVVRHFFAAAAAPDTSRRLGWDTPSRPPEISHAGDRWPRDGVGHTGFTGTMVWLDPPRGRYVVLLTNRVHPRRDGTGIRELRRAVMDAVVERLDQRRPR